MVTLNVNPMITLSKRDHLCFKAAKAVAKLSLHDKYRVGAVVIKGTDIVSAACNSLKSHPIQMKYNAHRRMKDSHTHKHHLHAEIDALLKVKDKAKLKGASIYIVRLKKKGDSALARPCPACYNFIKDETPIIDCYYSTESDYVYERVTRI